VERERYEVEDVIVFGDGRTSVTHRIIRMNEDEVVTRGDANNTEDTPITYKQIKGEVVLAIPLVGYLLNAIKSPVGTIVILGLAIFLGERSFRKDKRRDEETLDQIKAEIDRLKQQQDK
jgi:signal peptidase